MEQHTENQYDDDLTIGSDEYDDSYYTGAEDLFEISTDEESPISRLKSLILSIDWEITDEVLLLFNEELVALRDTWAEDKINLVYIQALEKISKYIYYKKADSHPSAIKLLLTLYHNLEKIVTSQDLTDEQKKEILFEDVKRFEQLKAHIKKDGMDVTEPPAPETVEEPEKGEDEELRALKAIVLGIDWEITDNDLNELRDEVVRLESVFAGNKPRLILLQGIGTLGAYIKLKKSDTHAEAFKVLHLFFESLEKMVTTPMSLDEEKAVLFPAVEKFNSFKTLIGSTITPDAVEQEGGVEESRLVEEDSVDEDIVAQSDVITPAFADLPEDEIHGFQADEEAHALGYDSPDDVVAHVADFFPDEVEADAPADLPVETAVAGLGQEEAVEPVVTEEVQLELGEPEVGLEVSVDKDVALQGVDVEEDEALNIGHGGEIQLDEQPEQVSFSEVDPETALQGVDVETEADDDSDEEGLLHIDGELAPALSLGGEEEELVSQTDVEEPVEGKDDIEGAIADFFGDTGDALLSEEAPPAQEPEPGVTEDAGSDIVESSNDLMEPSPVDQVAPVSVDREAALQGVEVETEADDDSEEVPLPTLGEKIAPALAALDEDEVDFKEPVSADSSSEEESNVLESIEDFFGDTTDTAAPVTAALADAEEELAFTREDEGEEDSEEISDFVERLDTFFGDDEQVASATLEDSLVAGAGAAGGVVAALDDLDEVGEEEVVFELVEDIIDDDELVGLQGYIDSLGSESDDSVLAELREELALISQKCADYQMEHGLVKLVSTLADKYSDLVRKQG